MKKMIIVAICLLLAVVLTLPVLASEPKVVLASGARFTSGSTLTVDIQQMTDMDARIHNAYLEGTVKYQWFSGANPIPGATGQSYTIQSTDKSIKVQVTCDDLVLTSVSYMVTNVGIVVTTKAPTTKTPTTKAPTTKVSTTKAPTAAPTTATPTQDPGVMPMEDPIIAPSAESTTAPSTASTTVPATASTPAPTTQAPVVSRQAGTDQTSAEEFPWWTVISLALVATVIITVGMSAIWNKK